MLSRYSLILLFLSIFAISCHKDDDGFNQEDINVFTAQVYQEVSSTIVGYVYDENNQPVAGADVAIYSTATKTSKHGTFIFKNVKMDKQGTYIKVVKNGYVLGSDYVYPAANTISYSYVKILKLDTTFEFNSQNGGTYTGTNGLGVTFAANSIATASGSAYTGKVIATIKYLDPKQTDLDRTMPGGLIADAANGNTVVLGTLGMAAVELRDEAGNELNLKQGSKATLTFPVKTDYKPAEIQLWSFDEAKGRWKEEGKALLQGNNYVAEVGHFSFWNCDAPFPLVEVCGKVLRENGQPVANVGIKVEAEGLSTGYGTTNENGEFCGKMPKGKKLTITVYYYTCNSQLTQVMVGPFDNNAVLDPIILSQIPTYVVSGTVNCNGNPPGQGIAVIKVGEQTIVKLTEADGSFSVDLTYILCGQPLPVTAFGFDNISSETSQLVTVTNATPQSLNLNVCEVTCNFNAQINYDCDTTLTATVTNGSGNFSYLWSDGNTTATLMLNPEDSSFVAKNYCVTITDLTANCQKVFCKKAGKLQAGIESNCQTGEFYCYMWGGSEPFTFTWSNGATTRNIQASAPGNYCVTVTDFNGCTTSACQNWDGNPPFISNTPSACNGASYSLDSSPFTNGYFYNNNSGGTINQGQLTYPINVNVFQTGFIFVATITNDNCQVTTTIQLPTLIDGLSTTVVNTSCPTCNDGKINITVNSMATCNQCQAGATKVFNVTDLNTDLSATNNAGMMAKGEYYVVVTDAVTGCYIAFKKVKIQ